MYSNDAVTKQVIIVFTDDDDLVHQLSDILNEGEHKHRKEYVLIRQSEISELGNTATASVLDLRLVGGNGEHNEEQVVACIDKIKGQTGRYPLYLLGSEDNLSALMQVRSIRQSVKRRLVTPLKPERVRSALSVSKRGDEVRSTELKPVKPSPKKEPQRGLSLFILIAILLLSIAGYWYLNQRSVNAMFDVALITHSSRDVTETMASTVLGDRVDAQNSSNNESLFNLDALGYIDQARQALKKGYIVGPEDVNALHFYRLALSIAPYGTLAQDRHKAVISELKSELILAIEQGKVGRSNSILRVITELDPFNADLKSLKQKLRAAFADVAP